MEINKVFAFQYCECIHESAYHTVSLHKTLRGAELALEFNKAQARKEFDEMYENSGYDFVFGENERWEVVELEIKE